MGREPGVRWRRTRVAEVLPVEPRTRRAVVRFECGHVAFRMYAMSVGQVGYCALCRPAT